MFEQLSSTLPSPPSGRLQFPCYSFASTVSHHTSWGKRCFPVSTFTKAVNDFDGRLHGGVRCMARRIYPFQRFRHLCFSLFHFQRICGKGIRRSKSTKPPSRFARRLPVEDGAEINEGLRPRVALELRGITPPLRPMLTEHGKIRG